MPTRCFFNVVADDVEVTARFYQSLFGFRRQFESRWFVHLADGDNETLELGVLLRGHEVLPADVPATTGGLLTIVVEDVDAMHGRAQQLELDVVEPPRDLFYGQRRMVLRDPAGTLVDVSSSCAPDPAWLARVKSRDDGSHFEP